MPAFLFEAICAKGWHPLLRVKKGMTFQAEGETSFQPIEKRVKRPGGRWRGRGVWSETGVLMQGTLLVRWEAGYEEPICAVTDLPAAQAEAAWYQMRFWIEDEYKDGKRGWFHWEQTKMRDPGRASRLWLVMGIALHKAILLGSELEAREQAEQALTGGTDPSPTPAHALVSSQQEVQKPSTQGPEERGQEA